MFTSGEFQVIQESRSGDVQVLVPRASFKNASLLTRQLVQRTPASAGIIFRIEPVVS